MLLTVFVSYVLFMIPAIEEQLPKPIDHNAACVMVAVVLERCMVSQSQSVSQSGRQAGRQAGRRSRCTLHSAQAKTDVGRSD